MATTRPPTTDDRRLTSGHRWFAAFYGRCAEPMNRRQLGPILHELLSGLSGDVLEVGAGTGATFEHYPAGARVVAIEPDPHMRRRAEARLRPNIDLRAGSAHDLPAADASADAVVCSLVLCTIEDVPRALAEIGRVLKPGGRLIFVEHVRGDGVLGRVQDITQPVWGWLAAGCHWNRGTARAIADAGFTFERIEHARHGGVPHIWGVARPS
jgi:SAM-dependent methyltransferase